MTNEWLEQQGLLSIRQLWMEIQVTPKPLRLFARLHEPPIADPQVMWGGELNTLLDSIRCFHSVMLSSAFLRK